MSGLLQLVSESTWVPVLADTFLKAAVLLGLALLASTALRRAAAAVRHLVWALAVAGVLALPILAALLPAWQVPLLPDLPAEVTAGVADTGSAAPTAALERQERLREREAADRHTAPDGGPAAATLPSDAATAPEVADSAAGTTGGSTDSGGRQAAAAASPSGSSDSLAAGWSGWQMLLAVWVLGVGLLAARLCVGTLAVWWIARRSRPVEDPSWTSLVDRLARQLDVSAMVRVLWNERNGMPMAWGIRRPVILLPREAENWSSERRRVVVLHELAHIKRRDCLTQLLAQVAGALHWFNPLVWIADKRLQSEREIACDDLVLSAGEKRSDYASHLLEIARTLKPYRCPSWASVAMARPSQLEGRLLTILDADRRPRRLRAGAGGLATFGALALVLPLAALQPWGASATEVPPPADPDPTVAGMAAEAAEDPAATEKDDAVGETGDASARSVQDVDEIEEGIEEGIAGASALARGFAAIAQDDSTRSRLREAFAKALQDESPSMRKQAAHALGNMEDPGAIDALAALLDGDPDAAVRAMAAWALGMIEDEAAVEPLTRALADSEADIRKQAAWALGMIESSRGVEPLSRTLRDDGDAEVRKQAAWALGMIEDPAAMDALIDALEDEDEEVKRQALWALGMISS